MFLQKGLLNQTNKAMRTPVQSMLRTTAVSG